MPVIAHPPCRAWGKLKHFAKPVPGEKELALFAVDMVRNWGGVLEHPAYSTLWKTCNLPTGRERDQYGGFTLCVDQCWFGHKAQKKTWLYIVGCNPSDIPPYPITFDYPLYVINSSKRIKEGKRQEVSKAEREHTPVALACWLIALVNQINFTPTDGATPGGGGQDAKTKQCPSALRSGGI